ncbi:Craniofacial development protein 2 [Stylophora pistillata]|uniref:Craniofacial development protein 2 n=1 Tax=Stylophora pistillata TaxID=50429 RepID=A0A2B4T173_STYPI|nr:Craniofacial development protein 2 [Stylophora pistillata]
MDTNTNRPERRTAFVARELKRFVALSETRRAEDSQLREQQGNYTFFWKGKEQDQRRIHGVGFSIRNYLLTKLTEQPVRINERLMTLRIGLKRNQNATVISAYAPTLDAEEEVKEAFYADLDELISATPTQDKLIILGNFNARVGRDHNIWEGVIGKNEVRKANSSGNTLLAKCAEHNLPTTNTVFRQRDSVKVSLQHPRSKHWHLIDYVIVRKSDQQDVLCTKAVTAADECWTDHRLISSVMRLKLKARSKCHNKPQNGKYNVTGLQDEECIQKLVKKLKEYAPEEFPTDVTKHWEKFKSVIKKTCDEATKEVYGPFMQGQVPLRSEDGTTVLKTNKEVSARGRKYFEGLFNQETTYNADVINLITLQPIKQSLCDTPTLDEVKKAILRMKSNKAAGPDGIPAEIYKYGGEKLQEQLHQLIIKIWAEEKRPPEPKNANMRKGDRSECGNYRGISLLSTADDNAIAAHTKEDLQTILDAFNYAYIQLGLKINAKKTQVLFQLSPNDTVTTSPSIKIGETVLENVDNFTYLGDTLSSHATVDAEVNHRIQQAAAAFGKLQYRVFQDRDISEDGKQQTAKTDLYSELTEGKRDAGGQKKRFKDGLKSHLDQCAIDTKESENLAMNTTIWRKAIRDEVEKFEERRSEGIRLKRERKKERQ